MKNFKFKTQAVAIAMLASMFSISSTVAESDGYEIWGSDQSNSVSNVDSRGVSGSWLWIWDSKDVETQLKDGEAAEPIGCDGKNIAGEGPCNLYDVFPSTLMENSSSGPTGKSLSELSGFGRLHGMLSDPQNLYMNVNIFAPDGGYIGIIDGETKEAVALFRVTGTNIGRSVHMSFWNSDGSALLVANLHGKVLERIDIERDGNGKITSATFNQSASLGVGKEMTITDEAKVYLGTNGQGNPMLGNISGSYEEADFGNLTPNGICKENECTDNSNETPAGRANNLIICPITSNNDHAYITFGGGGLLIADIKTTPMQIIAEYDNKTINGAGCGGVQVGNEMWLNAGVSASKAGATQSTFTMYSIDDSQLGKTANALNTPSPTVIFKDSTNTTTIGNDDGNSNENLTGQLPGTTTRRDAHGMARTLSGSHIHNVDRIQNNVEVFDTKTLTRTTYDLTSADGQGNGVGPCAQASVTDDPNLPQNDPAPDLIENTPDGKYLVVALRGPIPVSVAHAAQGSCPGVGIIELLDGGASGRLVGVLRTTNIVDNSPMSAPGGHEYTGSEHSDIHGASVRKK
ncbi:hypothetical protein Xen7305DRAFT_00009710 [Xenococcus sp. PCC 7305]|uniref:hypothetical protein n=1 Tax=Xenococcus sp. PCC 7305 TaxID=102125 RepID=UPI0002ABFA18|nr:hypothetical protein [Xenococcus sp. PCC 7305]ELS01268.1 hypothetical protein Xen7305DRAFT_00009710 [Xenococcus sp. PCC 7305]